MSPDAELEPLPLPSGAAWSAIGVECGPELHAGHQSRVFRASLAGDPIVVKLSDGRLVDEAFSRRVDVLATIAERTPAVVGPVPLGSRLVTPLDGWRAVAYPFVCGESLDLARESDVVELASALVELHRALAQLGPVDLPPVAALREIGEPVDRDGFGDPQLLHGDFSGANTLRDGGRLRVFDFDDCGYGPVEFEIGNSLYMVLFGSWMASDLRRFERFRDRFVGAYRRGSGRPVSDAALESAIDMRVRALGRWVDDPERAPIGIRTSSPEWHDTLRAFVESRRGRSAPARP